MEKSKLYYDLSQEDFRNILKSMSLEEKQEILSDPIIKDKLINCPRRHDFIWLAQQLEDNTIQLLLSNGGIEMLRKSADFIDKMNGILTSGNLYVDKLFEMDSFCQLVIDHYQSLRSYFYSLSFLSLANLFKYTTKNNVDKNIFFIILIHTSENVQLEVVKVIELPFEIVTSSQLSLLQGQVIDYLLNNDHRITTLSNLSFDCLFAIANKNVNISEYLYKDIKLIKMLVSIDDPINYRFLIESLKNSSDVSTIEKERKKYYEHEIKSYNVEYQMLNKYCSIYQKICKLIDNNSVNIDNLLLVYKEEFGILSDQKRLHNTLINIFSLRNNKEEIKEFFQKESNYQLTSMIIDYHFEDVYYNFLLDVITLYRFQKTEGRTLSDEGIEIYKKIINLYQLSYEDKVLLFEQLKAKNYVEKFYDDWREAKDKSYSLVREQMLNENTIVNHRSEELSKQYGVDVFCLDGEPFYAFVKSFIRYSKSEVLTPDDMHSRVDGSSYSLDGSDKLCTYKDPRSCYCFAYSDFNINQIVHLYPVDSFSKYIRGKLEKATSRINELYTPRDFIKKGIEYNEIVYAQRNESRNDELNETLNQPKLMAIYCYDSITEEDVQTAKNLGIGIILVYTKKYQVNKSNSNDEMMSMYDQTDYYITSPSEGVMKGQ